MMAIYYAKLTKIFWVSDSHLYHAYAWYKLYNLQKSYNKNLTQKDLQLMASSVLLATLAVTPYDRKHGAHHFELEMEKDRNVRMANLLGFTLDPKRDTREVVSITVCDFSIVSRSDPSNRMLSCTCYVIFFLSVLSSVIWGYPTACLCGPLGNGEDETIVEKLLVFHIFWP